MFVDKVLQILACSNCKIDNLQYLHIRNITTTNNVDDDNNNK